MIGLIGLFPIGIGIKELLELRNKDDDGDKVAKQLSKSRWRTYLPFLVVTTITFSGGEEIGIYTSIFATYNSLSGIITVLSVVMVLRGVWCGIAAYLVNHSSRADRFRRVAGKVLPFVLIGFGLYILSEAFLVQYMQI